MKGLGINASINVLGTNRHNVLSLISNLSTTAQNIVVNTLDTQHTIFASWGDTDTSTSAQLVKTYEYSITDDVSVLPGTTNAQLSSTQAWFQSAMTATLALDIAKHLPGLLLLRNSQG